MTNYGPPLRFKAVNLMDGTETLLGELLEYSDGATVTAKTDQTLLTKSRINDTANFGLYQSTGHTDANGVELFINDVVKCGSLLFKVVGIGLSTGLKAVALFEDYEITAGFTLVSGGLVIGNAHMSKAELQRRAEGLWYCPKDCEHGGITKNKPRIPNETTAQVFKDSDAGENLHEYSSTDELFEDLGI